MRYSTIHYSPAAFNFVYLFKKLFFPGAPMMVFDLCDLHLKMKQHYSTLFEVGKDSCTELHSKVYDKLREGWPQFEKMYNRFISEVVAPEFSEDFLFQKSPTIRFHIPANLAVGAFHTDAEFNHPAGEINFIIPLTNSDDTACPWIESEPGKNDFEAIPLTIGELVRFNGNELKHGNKKNETDFTRVSMDFRVLPISKYNPDSVGESITRKTRFVEGEYYERFKKIKNGIC
jgi:hypothetical protein